MTWVVQVVEFSDKFLYNCTSVCLNIFRRKLFLVVVVFSLSRISTSPPVDLHWFFEISISAFISNWDKNSVINYLNYFPVLTEIFFQFSLIFFFQF